MTKCVAAVLVAASTAVAATVSVIPSASIPANAPTVTFESLASGSSTYTEQSLTLTANSIGAFTFNGTKWASPGFAGQGALFSFASPVQQIGFNEFFSPTTAVTLYSDAAGTQSLGTFSTTHAYELNTTPRPFAFQSDTPFRSFSVTISPAYTFWVDDLRYSSVPEPTVIGAGLLCIGAIGLRRRRRDEVAAV